ncbi:MAG TPA: hypothetical protein VF662_08090 [Allosphingosinicella sp.]|jgi:hypothetical protein
MLFYRLDTFKAEGGQPIASDRIAALDDVEAVRVARSMDEGHPMELWCGDRKVKTFASREAEAAG